MVTDRSVFGRRRGGESPDESRTCRVLLTRIGTHWIGPMKTVTTRIPADDEGLLPANDR
jgi:hypothetical protein